MRFSDFEIVMSPKRMRRYLQACGGDKRKAQTLYRLNLRLSQEMFTVICCYEVALRNAIDRIMCAALGMDWLRDAIMPGGIFDSPQLASTNRIAHHEPVCFLQDSETISTAHLRDCYVRIMTLFSWMGIDAKSLLYGLDHVRVITDKIDSL